jgi:ADP-heptose:LPS heptosyltransferase
MLTPPEEVRRIAVVRVSGLGDLMFALPAIQALRETFPAAEIFLLAKQWHRDFFEGRPAPVDRVVVVPPTPGVGIEPHLQGDDAAREAFFAEMRGHGFDLAVQIHGGGRYSNPFTRSLGAKLTIGLQDTDAPPLDRTIPYVYFQPEILRCLEVVGLAGARTANISPRVTVTDADVAESRAVIAPDGPPLIAIHPGATDPRRRWPAERFAHVADRFVREGYGVAITATPAESTLAARVAELAETPVVNTCGQLSTGGLAGLLSRARLVLSNDSGPLHLAAAVRTPTVGIFWCANLINAEPITRATNRPVLSWQMHCPACGVDALEVRCDHQDSFVANVTLDEVLEQSFALLRERQHE